MWRCTLAVSFLSHDVVLFSLVLPCLAMALTAKQQAALSRAAPAQAAAMRQHFSAQNATRGAPPASGVPATRLSGPAPPASRQKRNPKAKARPQKPVRGKGNAGQRTTVMARYHPLPELEAPYAVLDLNNAIELSTSTTPLVLVVSNLMALGMGQASGGREAYPQPIADVVATLKSASLGWEQNPFMTVRCNVVDAPPRPTEGITVTTRRVRLASVHVTVQCIGTNGGLYPTGDVYFGKATMFDCLTRDDYGQNLTSSLIAPLIQANKLTPFTGAALLSRRAELFAGIDDASAYKSWCDVVIQNATTHYGANEMHPGMETILLYVPATTITVNYRVTINTQWCVRNPSEILLNTVAKQYTPSSMSDYNAWAKALANPTPRLVSVPSTLTGLGGSK